MSFQYLYDEGRVGTFSIHVSRLFDDGIREFLSYFIIVRAERTFRNGDSVEYTAFHPNFTRTDDGAYPPEYITYCNTSGKCDFDLKSIKTFLPDGWVLLSERKR